MSLSIEQRERETEDWKWHRYAFVDLLSLIDLNFAMLLSRRERERRGKSSCVSIDKIFFSLSKKIKNKFWLTRGCLSSNPWFKLPSFSSLTLRIRRTGIFEQIRPMTIIERDLSIPLGNNYLFFFFLGWLDSYLIICVFAFSVNEKIDRSIRWEERKRRKSFIVVFTWKANARERRKKRSIRRSH